MIPPPGELPKWWDLVADGPTFANFQLPIYMPRVGKLMTSSNFKAGAYFELKDPDFLEFMRTRNIYFDDDAFHIVNPNHYSNWKATMKYDRFILQPDFSNEYKQQLMGDVKEVFEHMKNSVPIRPLEHVDFRTDANAGKVAKLYFGCQNKEEFVTQHWDLVLLYWKIAHLTNYPSLWTQSGKVEMLKLKKILDQNIRAFTICPVDLFFAIAALSQDFNETLCKFHNISPIKHGITLDHRGFVDMMKEMAYECGIVIEGDCVKYDSTLIPFLFDFVKEIRYFCWDKIGMSESEWWSRINFYYSDVLIAFLSQSTGDIFEKILGNPSGFPNTTDDNCIIHVVQQCHQVRKLTGKSFMSLYKKHYTPALYADDHVITVSNTYAPIFGPYEQRAAAYADVGMSLDETKDFVSNDFENHVFLGIVAKKLDGGYVPTFDELKIKNSLQKIEAYQDPIAKFEKVRSLSLLCAFQPECFKMCQEYGYVLLGKYAELSRHTMVTEREARAHWLCTESEGGGFKNNNDYEETTTYSKLMAKQRLQKLLASGKISKEEYQKRLNQSNQARAAVNKQSSVQSVRVSGRGGKARTMRVRQPRFPPGTSQSMMNEGRLNANLKTMVAKSVPLVAGDPARNYMRTLIDNTHYHSRFPDSDLRETALCNSVVTYDIPLTPELAAGSATSRFSLAVQPIIGQAGSDPTQFQAAIAYPTDGNGALVDWAKADWTSPNSYTQLIGSRNPAVDINANGLFTYNPGYFSTKLTGTVFTAVGQAPGSVQSTNLITSATSFGQAWTNAPHDAVSNWNPSYNLAAFPNSFFLTSGVWEISITMAATLITPGTRVLSPVLGTNLSSDYASITEYHTAPNTAGDAVSNTAAYMKLVLQKEGYIAPLIYDSAGNAYPLWNLFSAASMDMSITQLTSPGIGDPSSSASIVNLIRPVAQTVLCTYFGPTLVNGGRIAAAYVDKQTLENQYFANTLGTGFGNYQFVNNLENVSEPYGAPIRDGAYAWWAPMDTSDYVFQKVTDMNADSWPAIIVSGYYENGTTGAGLLTTPQTGIIKVRIVTTWEYTSQSTFIDKQQNVASQADFDRCNKALSNSPHCMENKSHPDFIQRIMQFFKQHGGDIMNVGRAAAPIAGALLSMI